MTIEEQKQTIKDFLRIIIRNMKDLRFFRMFLHKCWQKTLILKKSGRSGN